MSTPLRVLHVHSGNLYGGIERTLVTLRRFERDAGLDHGFALAFEARLRRELGNAVVDVLGGIRRRYPWTVATGRRRLRRLLQDLRPHAAMVHGAWAQALLGSAVLEVGIPLVRWFHGFAAPDDEWEHRAAAFRPALALANSAFTAASARVFAGGGLPEVVHPPVPAPTEQDSQARARLRTHGAAAATTVVILHVARLEEGKGHEVLIDAVGRLAAGLDWQVWFVGGPQRQSEAQLLHRSEAAVRRRGLGDRVKFLGERADTRALYAAADLYCQPNSAPDAFGLTLVEALHAGLPVVTSALGGALEIVDAQSGLLLPPGDVAALARSLEGLVRDPNRRAAMAIHGPARATALCDPVQQGRRLRSLLEPVVAGDR